MSKKKFSLVPDKYDEVSVVDVGAGEGVEFVIAKRNSNKKGKNVTVEVISKKKKGTVCKDCGGTVASGVTKCHNCGSENIQKSLVVVRKAVGEDDEELETAVLENDDEPEEDEEVEDEDENDDEENEEDEDDDDEDEEDEDDDDDDEDVQKSFSKSVGIEALNISSALATDIAKVFASGKPSRENYEAVMDELNNVMDASAEKWFGGKTVSKKADKEVTDKQVRDRIKALLAQAGDDDDEDDDDEDDDESGSNMKNKKKGVKKSAITKRDSLPADVRKSLENADRIVEENETAKWLEVAKGYSHIPGNEVEELAKSLRALSEASPKEYEVLKKSLDAAEENLATSEVFKSYGRPGGGETPDAKKEEAISKAMEKDPNLTREQAEVEMMSGNSYKATA